MPEYVTREEFESRLSYIEGEIEGEKLVTRHILEQTRRNGDDLAAIKGRLQRVEEKLVGVDLKLLGKDVASLKATVDGLIKNLPETIRDVMREVLQERERKS